MPVLIILCLSNDNTQTLAGGAPSYTLGCNHRSRHLCPITGSEFLTCPYVFRPQQASIALLHNIAMDHHAVEGSNVKIFDLRIRDQGQRAQAGSNVGQSELGTYFVQAVLMFKLPCQSA